MRKVSRIDRSIRHEQSIYIGSTRLDQHLENRHCFNLNRKARIRKLSNPDSRSCGRTSTVVPDLVPFLVHVGVLGLHVQDIHRRVNDVIDVGLPI